MKTSEESRLCLFRGTSLTVMFFCSSAREGGFDRGYLYTLAVAILLNTPIVYTWLQYKLSVVTELYKCVKLVANSVGR